MFKRILAIMVVVSMMLVAGSAIAANIDDVCTIPPNTMIMVVGVDGQSLQNPGFAAVEEVTEVTIKTEATQCGDSGVCYGADIVVPCEIHGQHTYHVFVLESDLTCP